MRRVDTLGMFAAVVGFARAAAAQPAPEGGVAVVVVTAELDYQAEQALPCPTAADFERLMTKEMEYDPFAASTPGFPAGRFHVRVARKGRGLIAGVRFDDTARVERWSRSFETKTATEAACTRLVGTDVLADVSGELTRFARSTTAAPLRHLAMGSCKVPLARG